MIGSDFLRTYAAKGLPAWEAAALEAARRGELTPWPVADLVLTDGENTVILKVATDVLSIGPIGDHLRLPLTPSAAQDILNLTGSLLPTPWIDYQAWKQAPIKLEPKSIADLGEQNQGAVLAQYAKHSDFIDRQIAGLVSNADQRANGPEIVAGHKKAIVVSNAMLPNKVVIFGWYRPPPAPDVFSDHRPIGTPGRQPIQPLSNVHGNFYVDYSHGVRAVGPIAIVNGQAMRTADLYQHPTLSKLVSHEGPLRQVRYPSHVPPLDVGVPATPIPPDPFGVSFVSTTPDLTELALAEIAKKSRGDL